MVPFVLIGRLWRESIVGMQHSDDHEEAEEDEEEEEEEDGDDDDDHDDEDEQHDVGRTWYLPPPLFVHAFYSMFSKFA